MKHLIKKSKKRFSVQIGKLALWKKRVVQLTKKDFLFWLLYIAEERWKYRLRALQYGISYNRKEKANLYNFRRNIHRIEKGLSNKNIKDTFAESYILETVKYLQEMKKVRACEPNTLSWGEAVLSQYFIICKHTKKVAEAYQLYQGLQPKNKQPTWYPYCEKLRPPIEIKYNQFYQLALRRRSVRYYLNKKVEFDVVEKAMKVAALSPSACNRQAFKFLFYNDHSIVNKIAQIPGGVAGYEVPSIAVVIGSYRAYFDERDVNAPVIDSSLATMAFIFALETLGLSSVCINWPNLPDRDRNIRQVIHLEKDEFVVMLIGIGYPDPEGKIPYSAKKEINDLILCNKRLIIKNQRIGIEE